MGTVLPLLLGGLALFLYALTHLSEAMQGIFTERAKDTIATYTRTIFHALFIGTFFTVLLGSSSAMIILVIIFINAEVLTFRQAIGLIMGANIGTTFSSQIIALDITQYAAIPLLIGIGFEVISKTDKNKHIGKVLLYFGMLFFGLFVMEESVAPLRDSSTFLEWMKRLENPVRGALVGGLTTLVIQSSSATVGIAITLGKEGLITLGGGLAVMLGAEIGTCSDTLLATIRGKRAAIRAGVFHLVFNVLCVVIGLLLFQPLVTLVLKLSEEQSLNNQIANGHMLFNSLGVVLFLPFAGLMERLLNRWIPDVS